MSIKVGPLDLLEANDLCIEGQRPTSETMMAMWLTLRKKNLPCHAVKSQVLVMIRQLGLQLGLQKTITRPGA